MKTLALDARPAQRWPSSARRLFEMMYAAAVEEGIPVELWADGPLHAECEQYASKVQPFPASGASADTVLWCLNPDRPPIDHAPYISMICDTNPLKPDGRSPFKRWSRKRKFRAKVEQAMQSSWRIATDSEDARASLEQAFPGIGRLLHVIPLFAIDVFKPLPLEEQMTVLDAHKLAPGYIFFVGSFRRHKNWYGLMKSYAMLPDDLKTKHPLVFAGAMRRELKHAQQLVHRLGLEAHVHLLGETAEADLPALYNGAQLFVFPSYMEGFGLPPLEAMQCGTPVVASDRTSIPEVLGEAARYIDPDDHAGIAQAMEEILRDADLQAKMMEDGFAQAKTFNLARTGTAIRQMLEG